MGPGPANETTLYYSTGFFAQACALLKVMEGHRRGSVCDEQCTIARRTFNLNSFFASRTQVVPIGAIEAYDLMLCGSVLFKQGQRQSCMMAW